MMGTFENDEQRLLLYLADELPAADRAELDRRLAHDSKLAAKLDQLAALHEEIQQGLGQLDRLSFGMIRPDVVARSVGREIRQRLTRPKVEALPPGLVRRHRMLPWLIPSGIAAAIVVGTIAWVHHEAMVNEAKQEVAIGPSSRPIEPATLPSDSEANVALLEESFNMTGADVARADPKKDVAGIDDLSGYMLNLEAAH